MLLEIVFALHAILMIIVCVLYRQIGEDIARRMYKVRLNRLIHVRETAWLRDTRRYIDDGRNRIDAV